MYHHGWFQIAFLSELTGEISTLTLGPRRLAVVRTPRGARVVDACCPHRGADLSRGGRLHGNAIICPFHGFRIGLGTEEEQGFCVREYRTLVVGGLVFARLSEERDNGFMALMETFEKSRIVIPGFSMRLRSAAEMVIENAFDQEHFGPVHGIRLSGAFRRRPSQEGELTMEGTFDLPPSPRQRGQRCPGVRSVSFTAQAFSPGIVVSHLGDDPPYAVITSATPTLQGDCVVRLSLVLNPASARSEPCAELADFLLRRSRAGLEKDRLIWEHRVEDMPARYTPLDWPVQAFREFCAGFASEQ